MLAGAVGIPWNGQGLISCVAGGVGAGGGSRRGNRGLRPIDRLPTAGDSGGAASPDPRGTPAHLGTQAGGGLKPGPVRVNVGACVCVPYSWAAGFWSEWRLVGRALAVPSDRDQCGQVGYCSGGTPG